MKATTITKDEIIVVLSPHEVAFLSNAVNEALELVDDLEFQTRAGETRTRAVDIQAQLREICD